MKLGGPPLLWRAGAWVLGLLLTLPILAGVLAPFGIPPGEDLVLGIEGGTLHDLDLGTAVAIAELPAFSVVEPRGFRRLRFEARFTLPDKAAAPLWALYHLKLSDGGQVSVNGVVVGDVLTSTPDTGLDHVRPALFLVPPQLLRDGENRVELLWATHDSVLQVSPMFFGPADVVRAHYQRRHFWQVTMAQVGLDFALVNAALLIGIFALRRQEVRYLLMGLTALAWANVCYAYLLPPMPAALVPYWRLVRLCGIGAVAGLCWLVLWLETAPTSPWFGRLCVGWAAVGPLAYLVNFGLTDSTDSRLLQGTWGVSLVALGLVPLGRLARLLFRQWDWRRGVFLLAGAAGMLAGGADLLLSATGRPLYGAIGYSAQATSPLWFTAIVAVLVKDFADFLLAQQRQNVHMAERLAEQQLALQHLHELEQRRERERVAMEERQRIMQDMHDGLGSALVSALAMSERGRLDSRQTSALLRECIDDLRLAIDSLGGSDDGFVVAAGNLRFRMEPRLRAAGIALRWDACALDGAVSVPATRTLPLLRILQEALCNATRHAQARCISVTLASAGGMLLIQVRDDGRGFDPQRVRWGKGLRGMEKRARSIGAELAVSGGDGATVRVTLPLAEAARH